MHVECWAASFFCSDLRGHVHYLALWKHPTDNQNKNHKERTLEQSQTTPSHYCLSVVNG